MKALLVRIFVLCCSNLATKRYGFVVHASSSNPLLSLLLVRDSFEGIIIRTEFKVSFVR